MERQMGRVERRWGVGLPTPREERRRLGRSRIRLFVSLGIAIGAAEVCSCTPSSAHQAATDAGADSASPGDTSAATDAGVDGASPGDTGAATDTNVADSGQPQDGGSMLDSTVGDSGSSDGGPGIDGSSCVDPQLTFRNIGQGDINPLFSSGVGARTATELFIFSGYTGPDPAGDAGGANVERVYVQGFDPSTGTSNGPAQPLFAGPDPNPGNTLLTVAGAAIAPTGQIALVYQTQSYGVWVTFLEPSADASVGGLTVLRSVQFQAGSYLSVPDCHVTWSNVTESFVVSAKTATNTVAIGEYTATGGGTAGGVSAVATDDTGTTGDSAQQGGVGVSGSLLGVEWLSGLSSPTSFGLTVYNSIGSLVGGPTYVGLGGDDTVAALAGTANGFVCAYCAYQHTTPTMILFASTSGGEIADGGTFPTSTLTTLSSSRVSAVSDNVGTGGAGGVGVAMLFDNSTGFAYVHADGHTVDGPVNVFSTGRAGGAPSEISLTNYNGSFVITVYGQTGSNVFTQIAASGCN